jgi:hypothetical protein
MIINITVSYFFLQQQNEMQDEKRTGRLILDDLQLKTPSNLVCIDFCLQLCWFGWFPLVFVISFLFPTDKALRGEII